ncbi:MAG TPA: hypothetical protein PKI12_02005 [Bacteroidales bacterium]|nr:hypothetical protein [Bacteroidales bacterium]
MKFPTFRSPLTLLTVITFYLLILYGCSYPHLYHSPEMAPVPLFNDAAQFSGTITGSFGTVNPAFELQTAFSLPAHIALGAGLMTGGKNNSGTDYTDLSKYNYFEGFGGFYTSFAKIGVFEVYAGYGEGNETHTFAYNEWDWGSGGWVQDGTAEMKFSKLFIQPDVGVRTKYIEGAFTLRLSKINFKEIQFADTYYRLDELRLLEEEPISWLLEPGFTFRGGHDPVKFQIQGIFSANPSNENISFEHFRINFGINIKFGKKKNPEL